MFPEAQLVPGGSTDTATRSTHGPLYRVFILNDDVTPMDFVVHVLVAVFLVDHVNAEYIMYTAHQTGKAYIQTLPAHEARRRIGKARFAARLRALPLDFAMEPE
jgi:ATP-dependent Clp protease adaptor protein ClpS